MMNSVGEQIGGVKLNYSYYSGRDIYSDGMIEDTILDACINEKQEELLKISHDWAVLYHLSSIRENIIEWYPISKEEKVLEIGSGCGAITGALSKKAEKVTCVDLSHKRSLINAYRHKDAKNIEIIVGNFQDIEPDLEKYDVITLIGVWEYSELYLDSKEPFDEMLQLAKKHLTENGRIIIAIENKMGLKYWNGAQEDHTGKQYSGLNDYIDDKNRHVRTFSKPEIEKMLTKNGLDKYQFYYPLPDYKLPDCIYSDEYLPQVGEIRLFGKNYMLPRLYNFNDAIVGDQICADGMFPYLSNSYLIVCDNYEKNPIQFVKYNRERCEEYRIKTIINFDEQENKTVIKQSLNSKADRHISNLGKNSLSWSYQYKSIECVGGEIVNNKFISPFADGVSIDKWMYQFKNSPLKFVAELKKIIEKFLMPDERYLSEKGVTPDFTKVFGDIPLGTFTSLNVTNIDLIASNLKIINDTTMIAFDSEWVFNFPIPYRYVTWRLCRDIYDQYKAYLKNTYCKNDFIKEMGISDADNEIFSYMEGSFNSYVMGYAGKERYRQNYRKTEMMQNIVYY